MKSLQIKSVDLRKYTELVVDKQPSEAEIREIVNSYVNSTHPTHLAIAIPLDDNADFLAHGHVPAPLTVDEFTRVWIDAIHEAGVNVYFKGTFCGLKKTYDFGYETLQDGTADTAITDGKSTWLGRTYLWINTHLKHIRQGDIIGVMSDSGVMDSQPTPDMQKRYLDFHTELKKLYTTLTQTKPVYAGFSSNPYENIANGFIPSFLFDIAGLMAVDIVTETSSPQELEKALNDLYIEYRRPIFLSKWQVPRAAVMYPSVDNSVAEYFAAVARLRDKSIIFGLNYYDGDDFNSGIFTQDKFNDKGIALQTLYEQGGITQPNPDLAKKEEPEPPQPEPKKEEKPKLSRPKSKKIHKNETKTLNLKDEKYAGPIPKTLSARPMIMTHYPLQTRNMLTLIFLYALLAAAASEIVILLVPKLAQFGVFITLALNLIFTTFHAIILHNRKIV